MGTKSTSSPVKVQNLENISVREETGEVHIDSLKADIIGGSLEIMPARILNWD